MHSPIIGTVPIERVSCPHHAAYPCKTGGYCCVESSVAKMTIDNLRLNLSKEMIETPDCLKVEAAPRCGKHNYFGTGRSIEFRQICIGSCVEDKQASVPCFS